MKKLLLASAFLSLGACAPYAPGDCRYDNTCKNYPYNQNNASVYPEARRPDMAPAAGYYVQPGQVEYIVVEGRRYYPNNGYYYMYPDYRGDRYYYENGTIYPYDTRSVPPGGWNRPTQPENHPDHY